jgi:hypothetical protein
MFLFCSAEGREEPPPERAWTMRWRPHLYPVVIEQILYAACLATLSDTLANEADESGYLLAFRCTRTFAATVGPMSLALSR